MDSGELRDPTVVIVEDERELAGFFADALRDQYTVKIATDGSHAVDLIDHEVDLVLLDRRIPEQHGDDVLNRIREARYDCRVVIVTAIDPELDIVDMEFDDYLTKPVGKRELLNTVNEQLIYATYDEKLREYIRVRSKIDVLQDHEPEWLLADNEDFIQLCQTAESLRHDIEELFDGHEDAVQTGLE